MELKAAKEAEAKGEEDIPEVTKYVRVGDSQIVYELEDSSYEILAANSYDDLRHKEVFWADSDTITQIDVTLEGEEHVFTSEEDDISEVRTALKTLMADSFTDEEAEQKEEISLVIHLDNEDFPQVKIQLYRYDGSLCLAVVDGESVCFVERSSVMELVEAGQEIVLN